MTNKNKKKFVMPNMDFTIFDAEDIIVTSGGGITHSPLWGGTGCTCGAIWIQDTGKPGYWDRDSTGYHK